MDEWRKPSFVGWDGPGLELASVLLFVDCRPALELYHTYYLSLNQH